MGIRGLVIGAASLAALSFGLATHASAQQQFGYQGAVEDSVTGFVGAIPTSSPAIMVGSDGESHFDPFGAGFDTSDDIQLNSNWAPDPAFAAAFGANGWQQLPNTFTWVLPACIAGVCENANVPEPVGKWDFIGGGGWAPGTLGLKLFESNGQISDIITVANDGPNGGATITFASIEAPEPATWALMLLGFGGLGLALRARKPTLA